MKPTKRSGLVSLPSLVGFDRLLLDIEQASSHVGYPPHNIVKINENEYAIELAVAGFSIDEMQIVLEDHTLIVTHKARKETSSEYLYKGISTRNFTKKFTLAEAVEVCDAQMINGMLIIKLCRVEPEKPDVKFIEIRGVDDE